jgi:hypothetical protein
MIGFQLQKLLDFKIEISGVANLQGNSENTEGLEKTRGVLLPFV